MIWRRWWWCGVSPVHHLNAIVLKQIPSSPQSLIVSDCEGFYIASLFGRSSSSDRSLSVRFGHLWWLDAECDDRIFSSLPEQLIIELLLGSRGKIELVNNSFQWIPSHWGSFTASSSRSGSLNRDGGWLHMKWYFANNMKTHKTPNRRLI